MPGQHRRDGRARAQESTLSPRATSRQSRNRGSASDRACSLEDWLSKARSRCRSLRRSSRRGPRRNARHRQGLHPQAIGPFESSMADVDRLSRIAAELAEHMTLLHRDFRHGDRIAACVGGRDGFSKVLEIQLMFAGGKIHRGDGSIASTNARSCLLMYVRADRLAIWRIPLRQPPGSLPVLRRSRGVACARQVRRDCPAPFRRSPAASAQQGFGNFRVNLATPAPQHAFVCRLLNQRVLEA